MNAPATESDLRAAIVTTCRELSQRGMNTGTAGNVSVRRPGGDGFLITPTSLAYDRMEPADVVALTRDGQASGPRAPSSEWRFHRDILAARPEVGAVVHTHSPFATALACARREIPAVHYLIALFGGSTVRCADYATPGSQALSDHVLRALVGRQGALLANHGMVVVGTDLPRALALAIELEGLAALYWRALQAGPPAILPDDEIDRVRALIAAQSSYRS